MPRAEENPNFSVKAERIAKVIARAGLCSRREAERWILEGRVMLDGKVLESPATVVTDNNTIVVDGELLPGAEKLKVWRYHKPAGLLTTHNDPEGRPNLFDNLPNDLYIETDNLTNFNQNWLNKQISGWKLRYKFFIEVEETFINDLTGLEYTEGSRFENVYDMNVTDYESGTPVGNITGINSEGTNTFISTDAEIYGKNVNGLDCDGLNTYTARFTGVDSANFLYAYVDLYAWEQGTIFGSYQLSTAVTNLLNGNPLEPITGTTPTVTIIDPTTVDVEFNINPNNLPPSNDLYYTIGARIEILEIPPLALGKITEDGVQKQVENNNYKIVE